jgi:hypothetical protein
VTIDDDSPTSLELTVAASDAPTWLILQQSWNAGWTARADGDDLGEPVLVNGYANGWLLPAGSTSREIVLDWSPQRTVTASLWISLAAGIMVLALAFGAPRRVVAPADLREGRRIPRLALGVSLGLGLVIFAGPFVALAAVALGTLGARWRWLPPGVVATCFVFVGIGVAALEWRYDFPAAPDWPSRFSWAAPIVWLAVVTVVIEALRPALRSTAGDPVSEHVGK